MSNELSLSNYHKNEINRLERNLKKITKGDFDVDLEITGVDDSLIDENEHYIALNINCDLLKIVDIIHTMTNDIEALEINMKEGNLDYRIDTSKYNGQFVNFGLHLNKSLDTIISTINKA